MLMTHPYATALKKRNAIGPWPAKAIERGIWKLDMLRREMQFDIATQTHDREASAPHRWPRRSVSCVNGGPTERA